jgi:hypothetical protein
VQQGDAIDINAVWEVTLAVTCKTERWHEDVTLDSPIVCRKTSSRNKVREVTPERWSWSWVTGSAVYRLSLASRWEVAPAT